MMRLNFRWPPDRGLRILCLGAHSDDIEIGCGGTLLRLLGECREAYVEWVVLSATGDRADEARESARRFTKSASGSNVVIKGFRDGFFPYVGGEIKEYFEQLGARCCPDIVFTHFRHDAHQDHRIVSELTWNTYREHFILEYEVLKYDGDIGNPNFFVHLTHEVCRQKILALTDVFRSQAKRRWFDESTFWSMLRIRGIECNAPQGFAEAFYCRKGVW